MGVASWRIALASSIGTSHGEGGSPCQDFGSCELIEIQEGSVLVAVVSDGAGTAARAEVGSELAARTLIALVREYLADGAPVSALTRETVEGWIGLIGDALTARAEADFCSVRDYSSTLLAAIVSPSAAAFLQIGDGAIVVSHGEADGWSYVFWPQHGEFANTTNFVVSADAREVMEFEQAPRRIDEVALFTDGIENLVLHRATRSVHEPFFKQMFRAVRESKTTGIDQGLSDALGRYLSSSAVCERTDDDKTLVLATRAELVTALIPLEPEVRLEATPPVETLSCPTS